MDQLSPYWVGAIGLLFLILGYRAYKKKQVVGSSGETRGLRDYSFYLRFLGLWTSGILLMILSGILFQEQLGWAALSVFAIAVIVLGLLIFRFTSIRKGIGRATVKALTPTRRKKTSKETEASPRSWALAAASLPGSMRGLDHTTLAGRSLSAANERKARKWLKKEWEIDDEEEFEEVQDWLIETGHRSEFFEEIQRFRLFSDEYRVAFLGRIEAGVEEADSPDEKEELKGRVLLAAEKAQELTDTGFLAWDYVRYLDNCRAGFLAGYLEEEEAWEAMLSACQVLQTRYDSWEDAGEAYLMARGYWSVVETERTGTSWRKAFLSLRENPRSPWNNVPWELALFSRS